MPADLYANAIVMKTAPIIMKTKEQPVDLKQTLGDEKQEQQQQRKPLLDSNGKPVLDANGNPIYVDANGNQIDAGGVPLNGAKETQLQSQEHAQILEKERAIEELLRQYTQQTNKAIENGTESPETAQSKSVAVDFFLKMVKTYFALVLKFGDTVANSVIRMTMPAQIADPIISNTPLNIADLVKTADRVNQVLANPEFKAELGHMFDNTSDAVNPQIKMLLNKMADIFMDVAGKTGSKLASTAAISLSAFPPLAVAFDIANLISVGVNAVSSGVEAVTTVTNGATKIKQKLDSTPSISIDKYMGNTTEKKAIPKMNPTPSAVKKQQGGGIKEAGAQLLHDIGGDFIIETGDKVKNAFYNISDTVTPEIDKMKLKVMKYTLSREDFKKQVGGAKRTRRAVGRIRKTLLAFAKK